MKRVLLFSHDGQPAGGWLDCDGQFWTVAQAKAWAQKWTPSETTTAQIVTLPLFGKRKVLLGYRPPFEDDYLVPFAWGEPS